MRRLWNRITTHKWLALIIAILLICGLTLIIVLAAPIWTAWLVDHRVTSAFIPYPNATEVIKQSYVGQDNYAEKITVYWTPDSLEIVRKHEFFSGFRNKTASNGNANFSELIYILSELPQPTLDSILRFRMDLCCDGNEPLKVSMISVDEFDADENTLQDPKSAVEGMGYHYTPQQLGLTARDGSYIAVGYRNFAYSPS